MAAGAVALSLTMLAPAPAEAAKVKPLTLAGAGSDTTYWMMTRISKKFEKTTLNKHHNMFRQIPPTNESPFPAQRDGSEGLHHPGVDVGLVFTRRRPRPTVRRPASPR